MNMTLIPMGEVVPAESRILVDSFDPKAQAHAYRCNTDPLTHENRKAILGIRRAAHFMMLSIDRADDEGNFTLSVPSGGQDSSEEEANEELMGVSSRGGLLTLANWVAEVALADKRFADWSSLEFRGFMTAYSYSSEWRFHTHAEDLSLVKVVDHRESTQLLKEPLLSAHRIKMIRHGGPTDVVDTDGEMIEKMHGVRVEDYLAEPAQRGETTGVYSNSLHSGAMSSAVTLPPREMVAAFISFKG